jgi:hypothetical protein
VACRGVMRDGKAVACQGKARCASAFPVPCMCGEPPPKKCCAEGFPCGSPVRCRCGEEWRIEWTGKFKVFSFNTFSGFVYEHKEGEGYFSQRLRHFANPNGVCVSTNVMVDTGYWEVQELDVDPPFIFKGTFPSGFGATLHAPDYCPLPAVKSNATVQKMGGHVLVSHQCNSGLVPFASGGCSGACQWDNGIEFYDIAWSSTNGCGSGTTLYDYTAFNDAQHQKLTIHAETSWKLIVEKPCGPVLGPGDPQGTDPIINPGGGSGLIGGCGNCGDLADEGGF